MMNPTNEALADSLAEELLEEAAHSDACERATGIRLSLVARSLETTLRGRSAGGAATATAASEPAGRGPVGQWIELMSRADWWRSSRQIRRGTPIAMPSRRCRTSSSAPRFRRGSAARADAVGRRTERPSVLRGSRP